MNYSVDVDEADVAVLNQNLTKSKESFEAISKSLSIISNRSAHAATNIKPILASVNSLNRQKSQIKEGLSLLKDVSDAAAEIHQYETTLSNSVEYTGLRQYITTVAEAKQLFVEIKPKLKRFTNVLVSFETLLDKADIKLQSYFQGTLRADAKTLIEDQTRVADTKLILQHFGTANGNVEDLFIAGRRDVLFDKMKQLAGACKPVERPPNIPYERGSNGINRFNNELIKSIKDESQLYESLGFNGHISGIVNHTVSEVYVKHVIGGYNKFIDSTPQVVANDLLVLEVIDNLEHFGKFLENFSYSIPEYNQAVDALVSKASVLFKELIRVIEAKFAGGGALNEMTIPQMCVDLVSKVRRMSEHKDALLLMITNYKLGDWLVVTPPARFVSVYSSLIPNSGDDTSPVFLLSSFFSDVIDAIMVNIEIGVKKPESGFKKSMQGFLLVKNLVMVETIINKSPSLYQCLGSVGMERVNKLKNRFLKLFLDDWNYASYIIIRDMTSIATSAAHHGGSKSGSTSTSSAATNLTSKERDQIKELFRSFTESFEEALHNYQKYNITDTNLRTYLAAEIKKLITSAYFKLYDKYANSDFTKNKSKYVKYDKQQFERILNERL